mmetsp:Transcript_24564/g.77026  ORF Transcript_24564/g.77026 Transcript_24564/m.77026 type:complete len:116 (-) Transcript_24564:666-1013(-)
MATPRAPRNQARAPEKGVFPLDHDGTCKADAKAFLQCLDKNDSDHFSCRKLSRQYLECRMQNKLMAEEDLDQLGLADDPNAAKARQQAKSEEGQKERDGFLSGADQQGRKRGWIW